MSALHLCTVKNIEESVLIPSGFSETITMPFGVIY